METLARDAERFGARLGESELRTLEAYLDALFEWNERTNLTAVRDREEAVKKHLLDSLSVLAALPPGALALADVGSGAGLPGIPLKIARPELGVVLVESVAKKAEFLEAAIGRLGLSGISVANLRAEDAGRDPAYRGAFDAVAARAVAALPTLCEYALPLLKVGGRFVAQKSAEAADAERADAAIQALGGEFREAIPVRIDGLEPRVLLVVDKISETPGEFPRRAGVPSKRPL